jgi:Arc/MetJ-type ribon-helix-helix transcriptional regulator
MCLDGRIACQIGVYYAGVMQTISMRLPDDLLVDLEREAKTRRVTKSSVVRESLEKTLRSKSGKPVSAYDLAKDLAGKFKGAPRDLATNPKYMKGFGE